MSSSLMMVLAQDVAPPGFDPIWFILIVIAIFYFLVFMPQRRERQARQQMIDSLAKHDRVLTHGGIYGTVVMVKEDRIVLQVDEATKAKLTVAKSAIASVVEKKQQPKDKDKEAAST